MKKIYSLIMLIALAAPATIQTMDPVRHPMFRLIDTLLGDNDGVESNWNGIFMLLNELIDKGSAFSVNEYYSRRGFTLLCQAVEDGDLLAAKILLDRYHAKVDATTRSRGMTPLMIACLQGNAEIVMLLLQKGANPSLKNNSGYDSFYFAQKYQLYSPMKDKTISDILEQHTKVK